MGFRQSGGLKLNDCFRTKQFDRNEKMPYGLGAKDWYNWFIELCKLMSEHKLITDDSSFKKNYIAFLCLSNIFDVIFDSSDYHYEISSDYDSISYNIKLLCESDSFQNSKHLTFDWQYLITGKNGVEDTISGPFFNIFNWKISLYGDDTIASDLLKIKRPACQNVFYSPVKRVGSPEIPKRNRKHEIVPFIMKMNYKIDDIDSFHKTEYRNTNIRKVKEQIKNDIPKLSDKEIMDAFDLYFNNLIEKEVFKFLLDFTHISDVREMLLKK